MVQDASTDVILLFIEAFATPKNSLPPPPRAETAPVIVTKVGRSAGERATASHTASMAGWNAAYDAVFAKYSHRLQRSDEAVTSRHCS